METSLNSDPQKNFSLFVFLSPECPLCQNYTSTLNALQQRYGQQVQLNGIISGKSYSQQDAEAYAQKYNIAFPLWIDSTKQLTRYLQGTITPQVILLDNKNELLYKGAIDNWVVDLGKKRLKATEYYLRNAIELSLQDKPVQIKRTRAIGCKINDY